MKKFFYISLFATLALSAFADYQFPGWRCNDAAKFQASIASAPKLSFKCRDAVMLRMIQKPVNSFAEFSALVDATVDEFKGNADPQQVSDIKISLKKQITYIKNLWITDAWKFCQMNPTHFDENFVLSKSSEIGMTNSQAYTWLMDRILKKNYQNHKIAAKIIEKIIDLAPSMTNIDVKDDLKKLNRKFSPMLIKDKAKWEPIVAMIRTALETY